jgi:hypothetical protein
MEPRLRISLQIILFLTFFLLFLTLLVGGAIAQNPGNAVYLDPSQPIDVRVENLIKQMTLEEKAEQLVNQARAIPGSRFRLTTGGVRPCMASPTPERQLCFPSRLDWRRLLTTL